MNFNEMYLQVVKLQRYLNRPLLEKHDEDVLDPQELLDRQTRREFVLLLNEILDLLEGNPAGIN